MKHIVTVVAIALGAWCFLEADAVGAQVTDSAAVHVTAVSSSRWVPARMSLAQSLQRKTSFNISGVPLADALEIISSKVGLKLSYSSDLRRSKIRVSLKSDDLTVLDELLQVLEGTSFQPFVSLRGDAVLVAVPALEPARAPGSIIGQVTDSATGHGVGARRFSWRRLVGGRPLIPVDGTDWPTWRLARIVSRFADWGMRSRAWR
jgi:hypothetical protein